MNEHQNKMLDDRLTGLGSGIPWTVTSTEGCQSKKMPAGYYHVKAFYSEGLMRDGAFTALTVTIAEQIEPGDFVEWWSDGSNYLTMHPASGGTMQAVPKRRQ